MAESCDLSVITTEPSFNPQTGKKQPAEAWIGKRSDSKDFTESELGDSPSEVLEALTALVYSSNEAREAVRLSATESDLPLEERVRASLEHLSG